MGGRYQIDEISSLRVLQVTRLWHKEWFFMLTRRESCFNSCPLSSLPNDHSDTIFLSAGHFPIRESLIKLPQMTWLTDSPSGNTLHNSFNHSWNAGPKINFKDCRNVNAECPDPNPGHTVVLCEDKLPWLKWLLRVIERVFTGSDGHRTGMIICTKQGVVKWPITKSVFCLNNSNSTSGRTVLSSADDM